MVISLHTHPEIKLLDSNLDEGEMPAKTKEFLVAQSVAREPETGRVDQTGPENGMTIVGTRKVKKVNMKMGRSDMDIKLK